MALRFRGMAPEFHRQVSDQSAVNDDEYVIRPEWGGSTCSPDEEADVQGRQSPKIR
jgi:hypothetical protein